MWTIVTHVLALLVGAIGMFFVLKNNPTWLWPIKAAGKKTKIIAAIKAAMEALD